VAKKKDTLTSGQSCNSGELKLLFQHFGSQVIQSADAPFPENPTFVPSYATRTYEEQPQNLLWPASGPSVWNPLSNGPVLGPIYPSTVGSISGSRAEIQYANPLPPPSAIDASSSSSPYKLDPMLPASQLPVVNHHYPEQQNIISGFPVGTAQVCVAQPTTEPCVPEASSTTAVVKPESKPRAKCKYPDCRSTFARKYDVERHERNVHDRTVNILCPVYGCNRATKPFARLDKFQEHFRHKKHVSAGKLMCPVDGCSFGPGNRTQLEQHLISQPHPSCAKQPHLIGIIRTLQIRDPKYLLQRRLKGEDACPLRIAGCTFRLSAEEPDMTSHVNTHELGERLTYYKEIQGELGTTRFLHASCPLCKEKTDLSVFHRFSNYFTNHLVNVHTRSDLMIHSLELWKMLHPLYSGAPHFIPLSLRKIFEEIRPEAERTEKSTNDQPGDSGLAL